MEDVLPRCPPLHPPPLHPPAPPPFHGEKNELSGASGNSVVDGLNARFRDGGQSSDLHTAGVLHAAARTVHY